MTDDKKAKMLERVRALLAKADSTSFPAEADTFRAKADALMTQYAIEQWQVDAAQAGVGARPTPVSREFDMSWYADSGRKNELWALMQHVASHCRVTLVYWRYSTGTVPGVGIPSDLDYFDMLFTHLMLQMGKGLEPHPDPSKEMIENLVVMKEAGMKLERIAELLINAGQIDELYTRNMGVKFTKLYTDYCREHNRPRLRTTPAMYQRSYAQGFVNEIHTRLRRQERASTGSMELVLRDISDEVKAAAEDEFGKDPQRYALQRSGQVDQMAYHSGKEDGAKARISHNPNETVKRGAGRELQS